MRPTRVAKSRRHKSSAMKSHNCRFVATPFSYASQLNSLLLQLEVNDLRSAVLTLTSFVADQFVEGADGDAIDMALDETAPMDKRALTFTPGRGKRLAFTPGRGKRLAFTPGRGKRLAFTPGRGKRSLSYTPGRGKREVAEPLVFRGSRG